MPAAVLFYRPQILDMLPSGSEGPSGSRRSVRALVMGTTLRLLVQHKQFRHALRVGAVSSLSHALRSPALSRSFVRLCCLHSEHAH